MSLFCNQNSFLWKVDSTPPVYLFGTVHLPYDTLWDAIPDNVKTAFSSSGDIFLELQLSDKETSNSLQECQLLSNNRTIDRVLSPELVTRIEQYLEKIRTLFQAWIDEDPVSSLFRGGGSYSDHLFSAVTHDWKRKKPIWVLSLIGSLTEENIRQRKKPVLDRFLDNAARALGKNLKPLEGVNDHCQPLNRLEDDQASCVHVCTFASVPIVLGWCSPNSIVRVHDDVCPVNAHSKSNVATQINLSGALL